MKKKKGLRRASSGRNNYYKRIASFLRLVVIFLCGGGFTYQMQEFMTFYWTYPTVVDLQKLSPPQIEMPAITVCNPNGYKLEELCYGLGVSPCKSFELDPNMSDRICRNDPSLCGYGILPNDFVSIDYGALNDGRIQFTQEVLKKIQQPLEEYMDCTIEYAGIIDPCDMEYNVSSYYSREDLPQFCYTIYSIWGQPNKERASKVHGSIMKLSFRLNSTRRTNSNENWPKFNLQSNPSVQIAVHSPYVMPSPYIDGSNYEGGKNYEIRLEQNENHLLAAPYKTNCSDYMTEWVNRGGQAPFSKTSVLEECRMKKFNETYGCVPMTVNYPHSNTVCGGCKQSLCNYTINEEECDNLASQFNEPCVSISYQIEKKQTYVSQKSQVINVHVMSFSMQLQKGLESFDCSLSNVWNKECSQLDILIMFDRFEINKLKYDPKIESLSMFSVIGGYLGMWLGLSLTTVYNIVEKCLQMFKSGCTRKTKKKKRQKKRHDAH